MNRSPRGPTRSRRRTWITTAIVWGLAILHATPAAFAHGVIPPSLHGVAVPTVPGLLAGHARVVRNRAQAIVLGKALFWDVQVGSDGMACASCHHHAGADGRVENQLSPGRLPATRPTAATFEATASGAAGGPDYQLRRADFPLYQPTDPSDFSSPAAFATDDVVGSAGGFGGTFHGTSGTSAVDVCSRGPDPVFAVGGVGTRRVTSRNAPSVINAVFEVRTFWDGRANSVFNGMDASGARSPAAGVWEWRRGAARFAPLALYNASLASQAVGPPIDATEMSCSGRTFADIGRKLLPRRALQLQAVHPEDGVLGRRRDRSGTGLATTYAALVRRAFHRRFWAAPARSGFGAPAAGGPPYSQMEANFALFFGIAVQLYESTLVSDQTPFDSERDAQGIPRDLDEQQRRGLAAFVDLHCADCHSGPLLSQAAFSPDDVTVTAVDRKPIRSATGATVLGLVDRGFVDTGVVPQEHDPGVGGLDPFGHPLSLTAQYLAWLGAGTTPLDPFTVRTCAMTVPFAVAAFGVPAFAASELAGDPAGPDGCRSPFWARIPTPGVVTEELAKVDHGRLVDGTLGAFKVPSLRNVELTGPYMHNGGMATLEEVLEFYNRGGNVLSPGKDAQFLFGVHAAPETLADVAAFLRALTDERVRWERAPFDHPALPLASGHPRNRDGVTPSADPEFAGLAETTIVQLPEVGARGRPSALGPLSAFVDRLPP